MTFLTDYNAPLTEWGDVTEKYTVIRNLLKELVPESLPSTPLLPVPPNHPKIAYGEVKVPLYIKLVNTLQYIPNPYVTDDPIPMEYLPINEGSGQGYGYVLYRTLIPEDSHAVTVHGLKDYGVALLGTKPVTRLGSFQRHNFILPKPDNVGTGQVILDILAENAGRVNYGHLLEVRKGINGKVDVDGVEHKQWKIYSFEFKRNYLESIESGGMWIRTPAPSDAGPSLYKASLIIEDQPKDTFVDMTVSWMYLSYLASSPDFPKLFVAYRKTGSLGTRMYLICVSYQESITRGMFLYRAAVAVTANCSKAGSNHPLTSMLVLLNVAPAHCIQLLMWVIDYRACLTAVC